MSDTRIISRPELRILSDRRKVPLRLKGSDTDAAPLITRRSAAGLLTCMALAAMLFLTRGGTDLRFFSRVHLSQLHDRLVGSPEAPLRFLNPGQSGKPRFQLQGIVYSEVNPVAVVNATPLGAGELVAVKVGRDKEVIRCLGIQRELVEIKTMEGSKVALSLD